MTRNSVSILTRESTGFGWDHLKATAYRCVRSNDSCIVPAISDAYLVKIQPSAVPVDVAWNYGGLQRGRWDRGTMALLPIDEPTRWSWSGPLESLIFQVRLEFWNRVAVEIFGRDGVQAAVIPKFKPEDGSLRQLLLMLAEEFYAGAPNGPLYVDGLSLALVTRLLRQHATQPLAARDAYGALPGWKLKRITDYIEANLDH